MPSHNQKTILGNAIMEHKVELASTKAKESILLMQMQPLAM